MSVETVKEYFSQFKMDDRVMVLSDPEADHMAEGFEAPDVSDFDIEAPDFDGLCRQLGV